MKKFLFLIALFTLMGGVNSVKAEKVFASFSSATETWTTATNTFSWENTGNNFIATGLPTGDIRSYTNFHCIVSNFSENANFIRLVVKNNGKNVQITEYISAGECNIDLVSKYPDWDFSCVSEILLFGSNSATEGHSINKENPASVVVTDVYMEKPDAPFVVSVGGFGDEITSLDYITGGTRFAIGDGTNAMYWITSSVDNQKADVNSVPSDAYYYYVLEQVDGLDTDGDEVVENDNYKIKIVNASGEAFTHAWNLGSYLNYSKWGHLFFFFCKSKEEGGTNNYGGDGDYYAIWKVAYSEGNGFTLKNAGVNKYAKVAGSSAEVTYLKLYKAINYTNNTTFPANDEIFALSNATGYNAETGVMTNGTWTFATPVDLSNWKYIIIAMENGCADGSHEITITDNDGTTVKGDDYVGTDAGTGPNMWLSRWNNQNIGCFNLEYLKNTKGLDINKVKSLSIAGETKPFVVYLSNYDNSKLLSTNRWYLYKEGDLVRNYVQTEVGKFGTICLPYKASVAGAEVYSITSGDASSITLTKVNGLLEAGRPYFYKASDNVGQDNHDGDVDKHNVNFFRADFDEYDLAKPITSCGLIGTFSEMTAPAGANYLILNSNTLYDTDGATGDNAVTIGANKAYINMSLVPSGGSVSARAVRLSVGGANITEVKDVKEVVAAKRIDGKFYDLMGREATRPVKGNMYIYNGKTIVF